MKEHPIIFSTEMVRAILENRKIMTRRVIKDADDPYFSPDICLQCCPYTIGNRLWVRETWQAYKKVCSLNTANFRAFEQYPIQDNCYVEYKADADLTKCFISWRPSIHMPRWASRISLDVTSVGVERLQEITEKDAVREGVTDRLTFKTLWDSMYKKKYPYESNPYVWVISFQRCE